MIPASHAASVCSGIPSSAELTVNTIYQMHFDFVWRCLRRHGVPAARMDDAAQDAFLVVHRKLAGFEGRSSLKSWLFGIALRVAHDYRRASERKGRALGSEVVADPDGLADASPGPLERVERADSIRLLERLLGEIDEEKREVFMLAELEQMSAPEIAEALGLPTTTVYSRLRAARMDFERALDRRRTRQGGGSDGSE
ncbi:MAG: sigma-70 family RNA polymerase sigma factor [Polyangiaceae bacterium]|nr:sigma-70 family RNA polymerase sigma factor [Polyangiaceae bacterium]